MKQEGDPSTGYRSVGGSPLYITCLQKKEPPIKRF